MHYNDVYMYLFNVRVKCNEQERRTQTRILRWIWRSKHIP